MFSRIVIVYVMDCVHKETGPPFVPSHDEVHCLPIQNRVVFFKLGEVFSRH